MLTGSSDRFAAATKFHQKTSSSLDRRAVSLYDAPSTERGFRSWENTKPGTLNFNMVLFMDPSQTQLSRIRMAA
jgi:hypothetical protein